VDGYGTAAAVGNGDGFGGAGRADPGRRKLQRGRTEAEWDGRTGLTLSRKRDQLRAECAAGGDGERAVNRAIRSRRECHRDGTAGRRPERGATGSAGDGKVGAGGRAQADGRAFVIGNRDCLRRRVADGDGPQIQAGGTERKRSGAFAGERHQLRTGSSAVVESKRACDRSGNTGVEGHVDGATAVGGERIGTVVGRGKVSAGRDRGNAEGAQSRIREGDGLGGAGRAGSDSAKAQAGRANSGGRVGVEQDVERARHIGSTTGGIEVADRDLECSSGGDITRLKRYRDLRGTDKRGDRSIEPADVNVSIGRKPRAVNGEGERSTAGSGVRRTEAGDRQRRRVDVVIGDDQHFVVDSKVLRVAGSAQVVEPAGEDQAGGGRLGKSDETAGRVVAVLGRWRRNVNGGGTRTFQSVIIHVIVAHDVGGVRGAAARRVDGLSLRSSVAPTGVIEIRVRTPGILRRINAQVVRTACSPTGIIGQGEIYRRIPKAAIDDDADVRLHRIRGHRVYRRSGEVSGEVNSAAVIHYIESLGIRADSAGQVVRRIDVVPEILALVRRGREGY